MLPVPSRYGKNHSVLVKKERRAFYGTFYSTKKMKKFLSYKIGMLDVIVQPFSSARNTYKQSLFDFAVDKDCFVFIVCHPVMAYICKNCIETNAFPLLSELEV